VKAVVISDTHDYHNRLWLPEADILIHCGDFCCDGTGTEQERLLRDFIDWLRKQPFRHKIVVAGNHDHPLGRKARAKHWREQISQHCTYLQDEAVEIEGVKFYGSPWTPDFFPENWVFQQPRNSGMSRRRWDQIPEDTEVLITHGPPYGILDVCPDVYTPKKLVHVGCNDLRKRVRQLPNLRYHLFGHIHPGRGIHEEGGVKFVNASSVDPRRSLRNPPYTVLDLAKPVAL